ncbi:TonB-dependent siderophore receptor [Flavobacterium aciduliphilum]|nr:TonB-dependent siderophore receptor [Flavobacterium aciduliphilum]
MLVLSIGASCFAQQTKISDDFYAINDTVKRKILEEVIVTAKQQKKPLNIGKSGIKPMDLPQASAVISATIMQNQQTQSLSDILKNANGVYIMGTTGGYQEEIASRGFPLSSSNTFKNGMRYFNGMYIETSGLEKVELLKGSAALLYGNVSAGGILNLITKKPKFELGGEIGLRFGSFNIYKPTFDVYNAIGKNKKVAFRINGSFEKGDSFRDFVSSESKYVNPSLIFKLSKKTQVLVEADYTNDRRTADFGAGIINYELIDFPRNKFVGVSWGYYDSAQTMASATLTHKLSENWNLNFMNGFRFYETDLFSNTRPNSGTNGMVQTNGNWTRSLQKNEAKENYFIQQMDVKGNFSTGKINHQFLIGIDSEQLKTFTTTFKNYNNYDTINIFDPYNPSNEATIPILEKNTLTTAPINRFGTYVQDLINCFKKFKLLAGVRYSYQDTRSNVLAYSTNSTTNTTNYDSAFSPRIGLIYQPTVNNTLFASYSNSFEINTGQDESGASLSPSIIDQYEIGIKNKLFDERLFLNVTAYQIANDKFYQQSLSNGNTYSYIKVLAGEVRSQGVEIDLIANPFKGLSIVAGYSFNETKYRDDIYFIKGSQLKYNPKNTANFNINYNLESGKLKGLTIGLINTYFGTRYAGRPTRIIVTNDTRKLTYISDYFQMDGTIGYVCKKWAIRTKISNILNELNYNVHDDNSVNPIAPRNYSIAINYIF